MGNSKLAQGCQAPSGQPQREPDPDNGVLAQVPGDIVAQGMATLPPPSAPGPEHREVIVEVENIGPVRLFVARKLSRHGRQTHSFWSAYRAEIVR